MHADERSVLMALRLIIKGNRPYRLFPSSSNLKTVDWILETSFNSFMSESDRRPIESKRVISRQNKFIDPRRVESPIQLPWPLRQHTQLLRVACERIASSAARTHSAQTHILSSTLIPPRVLCE